MELTSADEDYIMRLATILAPCILRPKLENTLTMNERYNYRLVRDLFAHKDQIFGELKRQSSLKARESSNILPAPGNPTARRERGLSTNEMSRKDMEQERMHMIAKTAQARSRGVSPARGAGSIQRERSPHRMSGDVKSRFPVAVHRQSLEVPGATVAAAQPPASSGLAAPLAADKSNGGAHPQAPTLPATTVTAPLQPHPPVPAKEEKPLTSATGGPVIDFPEGTFDY